MTARSAALTTFLLAGILFLTGLNKPFYTRGEPREALVAQGMLATGDWILGRGYGDAVASKPPLTHWLITAFSKVTGSVTELTSRLPAALASILFATFFCAFLLKRVSPAQALTSTAIMLFSVEWFRAATTSRVDLVLSTLMAAGLLLLFESWENSRDFSPGALVLFAGAILAKGPVGALLPGLAFGIFMLLRSEPLLKTVKRVGVVVFPALILASAWYIAAYVYGGEEFFNRVYYENIARLTSSMDDQPHRHSPFYFVGTLMLGLLPWTLVLLPSWLKEHSARPSWQRIKQWYLLLPALNQLAIVVIITVFLFFCIPAGKRSVYLLPTYPFWAILMGEYFFKSCQQRSTTVRNFRIVLAVFVLIFATLIIGVGAVKSSYASVFGQGLSGNEPMFSWAILKSLTQTASIWDGLLLALVVGTAMWILWRRHHGTGIRQLHEFMALLFVVLLYVNEAILPRVTAALSPREFAQVMAAELKPYPEIYSFGHEFYALSFYLNRDIFRTEVVGLKSGPVILLTQDMADFKAKLPLPAQLKILKVSEPNFIKPGYRAAVVLVDLGGAKEST